MDHSKAVSLLEGRLPATAALEVLRSLDPARIEIYRLEGFLRHDDGRLESRLDLIINFENMQQFTAAERLQIAHIFISNRATDDTYFELFH